MNAAVELLADSVRQAFESAIQLPRLITSTTDPLADINGLRIYQFRQPDDAQHPIGIVLGELIVNDCPLLDLLSVINNSGMRFKWDDLFDGSTILGGPLPGLDANIVYSKTRAVWPTSARDLVVAISTRRYGDSVIMTASSVPETVCRQLPFPVPTAKQTGCVRAQLDFGSWIFTPMPPESKDAGGRRCDDLHTAAACAERLKVQYLVKTNPNGSIPRAILSMLSKQLPLCIRNAVDCLRSRGACPSVMRLSNTLRLLENRYDPDKHSSLLRLECKPGKALLVVRLDVSSKWLELFNAVQITAPLLEQSRYSADTLHSVLVELQWINAADQTTTECTISIQRANSSSHHQIIANNSPVRRSDSIHNTPPMASIELGNDLLGIVMDGNNLPEQQVHMQSSDSSPPPPQLSPPIISPSEQKLAERMFDLLDAYASAETGSWIRLRTGTASKHRINYLVEELPTTPARHRVSTVLFDQHPSLVLAHVKRLLNRKLLDNSRHRWSVKQMTSACPCFAVSNGNRPIGSYYWSKQNLSLHSYRLGLRYYLSTHLSGIAGFVVEQIFIHPPADRSLLLPEELSQVIGGTRLYILCGGGSADSQAARQRSWLFSATQMIDGSYHTAEQLMQLLIESVMDSGHTSFVPFLVFPTPISTLKDKHHTLLSSRGEVEEKHAPVRIIDELFNDDFPASKGQKYRLQFTIDRPPLTDSDSKSPSVELLRLLIHSYWPLENSSSNQRCYQISLDSKESPEISALLQTSTTTQQSLFLCPSGSDGVKPPLIQIRKHQYRSFVISWLPNGWPADAIEFPISVLLTVSAFDAMKLKHNRTADEMPPLITATEYTAGMQSEMNRPLRKRVLVGKQRGLDTVNVPATMPSRVPVADDTFRIRRTLAILLMMLFIVLIYNYHSKYTL